MVQVEHYSRWYLRAWPLGGLPTEVDAPLHCWQSARSCTSRPGSLVDLISPHVPVVVALVQSLSRADPSWWPFVVTLCGDPLWWPFVTPWTAARQASLPFTISRSLLKFVSMESMVLIISSSAALFSSCLPSFPASGSFPMSQLFASGGQSAGASPSASVLPVNTQGRFPLGLNGLISLKSKGLSSLL